MKLFEHQKKALDQTEHLNRVAYYLDMGLGKTFVGAEKMMQLDECVNLVVCQKSKVDDWVEHLEKHYHSHSVYNLTKKDEFQEFMKPMMYACATGVINYDLLFRRPSLRQLKDFTLMLDESSLIQNETAKRTKFILSMNPSNVILLSGTPSSGKYENLWSQLHLLGWNISKVVYNRQYINWKTIYIGGFPQKIVDKENPYKNVDRLKTKMCEHGAVFMKTEECFDLPDQIEQKIMIDRTKEYKKFIKDSYIQLSRTNLKEFELDSDFWGSNESDGVELVGDNSLTKMLYARQLCGQYNKEKLQAVRDLVQSTNDRLIIFYNFNEELRQLVNHLNELNRPYSFVNGEKKDLNAYEQESDSITFVQYQAGSMGLNLQKANRIVYFTLPLSSELYEQSKKRIHRIGQNNTCFYYPMICKGSIEEDILETLEMRKDYNDELFRRNKNLW